MQEKKNKKLLALLIGLIVTTTLVILFEPSRQGAGVDKDLFRADDLNAIDRVVLESMDDTLELTFNGTNWRVNNIYNADRNMVTVLFATLKQAEPWRPVSESMRDSLRKEIEKKGVKVSLFRREDPVKTFFAGGNTAKTQAWFMDPASGNIYLMAIPGYRVYVSGIFELQENGWRDKLVFDLNWRNFKGMKVEFPNKPADNFTVVPNDLTQFNIQELPQTDTAKLFTFLDEVSLLTVDEYVAGPRKDSLSNLKPTMTITIEDIAGRLYILSLLEGGNERRVPGLIQGKDVAYFDQRKARALLRPRGYFSGRKE